ncbi:MAG: hypothetical protein B0A82_22305 [Alkalinema sp. CACIAM 70d]|nr:MAG: hypothetical protein B0A82_22305 [Alkalinema sp. CACIAM 70d]
MANRSQGFLKLEFYIRNEHPQLLQGLDLWLQLGLLSEAQIQKFARQQLTCDRPIPEPQPTPDLSRIPAADLRGEFILTPSPTQPLTPPTPKPPRPQTGLSQLLTRLMAEIAVVWLLFLGVFLVVISSAVLAASQWQNVTPIGQYAILWAYTIAFGAVGWYTAQNPSLRLTSRMLQITTLLIIPVNFWMMDGFRLWNSPPGWAMVLFSAITLSLLQFQLLRSSPRLTWLNNSLLSWLNWGWAIPGIPLTATYAAILGTTALQLRTLPPSPTPSPSTPSTPSTPDLGKLTIAFATLLLIGRATLAAHIPLSHFGLGLGLCGWLLIQQNRSLPRPLWAQAGAGLLSFGWLVAVTDGQLWQALGCSLLGLLLLWQRLVRSWRSQETVALIIVGLQTYSLLRVLFPPSLRSSIMAIVARWANLELGAWELTGLGFFVTLLGLIAFAQYLQRQNQPNLAQLTEKITLAWGIALALPGLFNPLVRAIYFTLSALLLGVLLYQRSRQTRPIPPWRIHTTHSISILAGLSWIIWAAPNLDSTVWATIFLAGMVVEWALCLRTQGPWQTSTWYMGLGFATIGYVLLNIALWGDASNPYWSLSWLAAPIMLWLLARSRRFPQPRQASALSVLSLVLAPGLTRFDLDPFLISTAIVTPLMALNAKLLRNLLPVALTLGAAMTSLSAGFFKLNIVWFNDWLFVWCTALSIGLWLLRQLCLRSTRRDPSTSTSTSTSASTSPGNPANNPNGTSPNAILTVFQTPPGQPLPVLYARAANGWAIGLTASVILILTLIAAYAFTVTYPQSIPNQFLIATGLVLVGIGLRLTQGITTLALLGLGWTIELAIAFLAEITKAPLEMRIIANLTIAWVTQIAGDGTLALRRDRIAQLAWRSAFAWFPLGFASFALLLIHLQFTEFTGLWTIVATIPFLSVGRRQSSLKALSYLGIIGFSVGAYELLLYQISQAPPGGQIGDAVILLAGLATTLTIGYRLLLRPLVNYSHLGSSEITALMHLHWGLGTLLAILALPLPHSVTAGYGWAGLMAALAVQAISQGRQERDWTYPGVLQAWAAIGYLLYQWLPDAILWNWGGAIATLVAAVTYAIPWRRWGWDDRPWQHCTLSLPTAVPLLTALTINVPSLLITGGFYAGFATVTQQIRVSYLGLLFAIWGLFQLFMQWQFQDPLWYVSVLSLSLLYIVQVDPSLRSQADKEKRHWIRCLAVGLFCATAFLQSEQSWLQGLLTIGLGLGLIFAGLGLRVRAYLYVGTVMFMLKVLRQLWLFISDYSLLLWGLGILVGLLLIWIAATFEARRSQAIAFVQYWVNELDAWE